MPVSSKREHTPIADDSETVEMLSLDKMAAMACNHSSFDDSIDYLPEDSVRELSAFKVSK